MKESKLLANPVRCSESHKDQWKALSSKNSGIAAILNVVNNPQGGGDALIFSHDDPDGITSGLIFKRMLAKKGWRPVLKLPEGFVLSSEQFEAALKENSETKVVFILDKGTLAPYSVFGKRIPVFIVDHHPTPKPPTDCVIFNPSLESYTPCSASILAHGIATLAGTRDSFDDLLCLIGLKGDWVIEPMSGVLADFAKPFFVEYGMRFKNLFKAVPERPTMFDAQQREFTCLLSSITEFVHATGGGGFQYFYHDRDVSLKNINHPECITSALEKMAEKVQSIQSIETLEDFVRLLPKTENEVLKKIFSFFLQDWEKAGKLLDSSVKVLQLADTSIYLFVGGKVPLLPMIGSIKLFELKQVAKDKCAQIIMVSSVSPEYTHVSVRGTADQVHSGKFCNQLATTLQTKFPNQKNFISGGGHPRAAECMAKSSAILFYQILSQVIDQLSEMADLDRRLQKSNENKEDKKRAVELGLDYFNVS